jgi:hypothetical protein
MPAYPKPMGSHPVQTIVVVRRPDGFHVWTDVAFDPRSTTPCEPGSTTVPVTLH